MPPPASRIHDDLKGIIRGELLCDELSLALYSTDASIFEVRPAGVVLPRDEEDVQTLVQYARANEVALVPRGAGTGLAGESLGPGLVVDLSRHFRAIREVSEDRVRAQAGVVCRRLNEELGRLGRRLGPDPTNQECTLGGMAATNASGPGMPRRGSTRDHVLGLRAILDNGDVVQLGSHSRWPASETPQGRLEDILLSLGTLLEQNAGPIRAAQSRAVVDRCGYVLQDVLRGDQLDLARLVTGSEGTLALITEVTLRAVPIPAGRALVLLGFDRLDHALEGASQTRELLPAGCQLIERRLLQLARAANAEVASLVPAAEAVLLVELEGDTARETGAAADQVVRRGGRLARWSRLALEGPELGRLEQLKQAVLHSLYGLRGTPRPVPFLEDVAVPVDQLPGYLHRVQDVLRRFEVSAPYLIETASGQVQMLPFADLSRREEIARMWSLADEVYGIVLEVGGTISTRHGVGLARSPWLSRQLGPLVSLFRQVKSVFDPLHLFNPGKMVPSPAGPPTWPVRLAGASAERDREAAEGLARPPALPLPMLEWGEGEIVQEARSCTGCGGCRTEATSLRMCPLFRATGLEAATPRAKANLVRYLLQAPGTEHRLSDAEVREVADLCVNCKMCELECPTHVDVPRLMLEAKAANAAKHGLDRTDRVLAWTETFAFLGSALAPLTNLVLSSRAARWVLEKLCGVSRRRRLPAFALRSFLRVARQRGWTRKPGPGRRRVAYFVDVFARYNDPLLGVAVVEVLHHQGIEVYVPPQQYGSGMAPLAGGDVETARETVAANVRVLADLAREGFLIVCSEPTAALMLRQDALHLLDSPDARLVAEHTVELTALLWQLHQEGKLRTDFQRLELSVGHHVPCHLKALRQPPAAPGLLSLIPGMRVHTIDVSCSGMAGTFGLRVGGYETSLEAGRPMLEELARPRVLYGSTECSPCRLQMEDGANKRTLHPAQYLALAYGLLPEVWQRLHQPLGKRLL